MKKLSILGIIGRGIGIVFIVIIIIAIVFIAVSVYLSKLNNSYKGDFTSVISNSYSDAPKALIIFQPSRSKMGENIANELARGLNEEGYEVTLTYPGKHVPADLSQYSLLAFGSAVYAGQPSTMLTNTMKKMTDLTDKIVIFYSIGSMEDAPEFDILKESLNGKEPDYTAKFTSKSEQNKIQAYELGLKAGEEIRVYE